MNSEKVGNWIFAALLGLIGFVVAAVLTIVLDNGIEWQWGFSVGVGYGLFLGAGVGYNSKAGK